jgi:hypothetical protein
MNARFERSGCSAFWTRAVSWTLAEFSQSLHRLHLCVGVKLEFSVGWESWGENDTSKSINQSMERVRVTSERVNYCVLLWCVALSFGVLFYLFD